MLFLALFLVVVAIAFVVDVVATAGPAPSHSNDALADPMATVSPRACHKAKR